MIAGVFCTGYPWQSLVVELVGAAGGGISMQYYQLQEQRHLVLSTLDCPKIVQQ
jgi:hypothetical protein